MKRLGTLDASWLAVESEDTPMHVGNLQIFSLPEDAPETFLRDMLARMKAFQPAGFFPPAVGMPHYRGPGEQPFCPLHQDASLHD